MDHGDNEIITKWHCEIAKKKKKKEEKGEKEWVRPVRMAAFLSFFHSTLLSSSTISDLQPSRAIRRRESETEGEEPPCSKYIYLLETCPIETPVRNRLSGKVIRCSSLWPREIDMRIPSVSPSRTHTHTHHLLPHQPRLLTSGPLFPGGRQFKVHGW